MQVQLVFNVTFLNKEVFGFNEENASCVRHRNKAQITQWLVVRIEHRVSIDG